jgi:hypothetical protein
LAALVLQVQQRVLVVLDAFPQSVVHGAERIDVSPVGARAVLRVHPAGPHVKMRSPPVIDPLAIPRYSPLNLVESLLIRLQFGANVPRAISSISRPA